MVAIGGALLFLVTGLVRWEDINSGVNWGVVLLYAAAVSLGVEMKATGAAEWVASSMFVDFLSSLGAGQRHRTVGGGFAPHDRGVEYDDGGRGGGGASGRSCSMRRRWRAMIP